MKNNIIKETLVSPSLISKIQPKGVICHDRPWMASASGSAWRPAPVATGGNCCTTLTTLLPGLPSGGALGNLSTVSAQH